MLVWGAPQWWLPATLLVAGALGFMAWGYRRAPASAATRLVAILVKSLGIVLLGACLAEPLLSSARARPGANLIAVVADNSQSLQIKDPDAAATRGEQLRELLAAESKWQVRLSQDFDVRRYAFDARLRAVDDFSELPCDGPSSSLASALENLARRYQDRPLAGILLLSDGNATDAVEQAAASSNAIAKAGAASSPAGVASLQAGAFGTLPPVYPVVIGSEKPPRDVAVSRVTVSQTGFEDAPVTVQAEIAAEGYAGKTIVAQLLDEAGKQLEEQRANAEENQPLVMRFKVNPEQSGVSFYQVRAAALGEQEALEETKNGSATTAAREATLINNRQLITVDRGGGPYRVLYIAGRPNWEFKFLNRAIADDPQLQLVGLVRIARREPKFDFRSRAGESTNPLFRGFGNKGDDSAESYDKPVLVRLGTEDALELQGGFPQTAEDLYRYHAIILDDLEAEFFTPDQMSLVQKFVSQRGGGLLMLGGQESLASGKYERTPIGELLPVYLDRLAQSRPSAAHRLELEREGWLQPWVRLRSTEADEKQRLAAMPAFQTFNRVRGLKPGATTLASAVDAQGVRSPALVEQRFGKGRALALTIGDLWRWGLKAESSELKVQSSKLGAGPLDAVPLDRPVSRDAPAERGGDLARVDIEKGDFYRAWRQLVRSLVADVSERIEVEPKYEHDDASQPVRIQVRALDAKFEPLDNATVTVKISAPEGEKLELAAVASADRPGAYEAIYVPRQPGAYRADIAVAGPDGADLGTRSTGWTSDPAAAEFRAVRPNRALLERIARESGGQVVRAEDLESFVADLPNLKAPITEPSIRPLWHQSWVFLLAIVCLAGEWALRRWRGLP